MRKLHTATFALFSLKPYGKQNIQWTLWVCCKPAYYSMAHHEAPESTVWDISSETTSSVWESAWNSWNGPENAVISGHHYHPFAFHEFYPSYEDEFTFQWEEGQFPNNCFSTPETIQVSGPEPQNNLVQIVNYSGSSELSNDIGSSSVYELVNFNPAQYYGSTERSVTKSMKTPSIEEGKAHNPIVLTDEAPVTPISARSIEPPIIVEWVRKFYDLATKFKNCQTTLWKQ